MPNADAIKWFKTQFQTKIEAATKGTPFTVDMLVAIACQETGFIWNSLRKKVSVNDVVRLCVGDVINAKYDASGKNTGRKAFPLNKADLLTAPRGREMYEVARKALVDMSAYFPTYQQYADNPERFCHGYGVFQYDIQGFKTNPEYFLQRKYENFDQTLARAVSVLKEKQKRVGLQGKTALSNMELAMVAIAYNKGSYDPALGLKQGHKDKNGVFYGEHYWKFFKLSQTIQVGSPAPGPAPAPAAAKEYVVVVQASPLNLRREPKIPAAGAKTNVIAALPNGHRVKRLDDKKTGDFVFVETVVAGKTHKGYCSIRYLRAA